MYVSNDILIFMTEIRNYFHDLLPYFCQDARSLPDPTAETINISTLFHLQVFIYSFIYSFAHLFIQSVICWFVHPFSHLLIFTFSLFIYSCTSLFMYQSINLFIHRFVSIFIHFCQIPQLEPLIIDHFFIFIIALTGIRVVVKKKWLF